MLSNARQRAARYGIPFNLSLKYLESILPKTCPIFGIPLQFHAGEGSGPRNDSPSLDCIVRQRGYVPENVLICSHRANRIKSDATLGELDALSAYYRRFHNLRMD